MNMRVDPNILRFSTPREEQSHDKSILSKFKFIIICEYSLALGINQYINQKTGGSFWQFIGTNLY